MRQSSISSFHAAIPSKILVTVMANGSGGHNYVFRTRLVQTISGGSAVYPIIGDTAGSNFRCTTQGRAAEYTDMQTDIISFLDAPATTSEVEYKIEISTDGTTFLTLNRNNSADETDAKIGVTASTITAMEIAVGVL